MAQKVAFVTGAASGIGRGIAEACAAAGMRVVLSDVRADALTATAAALRDAGATVRAVVADVADPDQVQALADETVAAFALPPEIADKYTLDIDLDAGPPPAFTIELAPKSGSPMDGDVTLTLNSDGVKTPAGKW